MSEQALATQSVTPSPPPARSTGYSTSINGAAQHIIDLIDAQKDYGNDYVNQGMRYVGGMQQYLIDAQTIGIYQSSNSSLNALYADAVPPPSLQQSMLAAQITSLGLQMQAMVAQICQSYSYQTTGLFQRCVKEPGATTNPLDDLCSGTANGEAPSMEPLHFDMCGTPTDFIEEAHAFLAPYGTINELAQAVNCYVDRVLWEKLDANEEAALEFPFVALKVTHTHTHTRARAGFSISLCNGLP